MSDRGSQAGPEGFATPTASQGVDWALGSPPLWLRSVGDRSTRHLQPIGSGRDVRQAWRGVAALESSGVSPLVRTVLVVTVIAAAIAVLLIALRPGT